ncbi:DoxX family protein [Ekhidna sp.]|uniref:DoxX family protein n=1 Tax=Ekhidna sp. TaxID=2608089 RepID=UPI003BABE0C0
MKLKKYADLPIRLTVGFHLIYGTQDNIFSWDRMIEFRDFLDLFGMPFPLVSAVISVYAQFICGLLFIIGWQARIAGLIMIVNFIFAILLVHLNDPYPNIYPAISMLAGAAFIALNGVGYFSIDELIKKVTVK